MTSITSILRDGSNVDMPALRSYLADIEAMATEASAAIAAGTISALVGDRVYATQAALYADLVPADNLFALVYSDADPLKNGLYQKDGATTAGDWDGPFDLFGSAAASTVQPLVDEINAAAAQVIELQVTYLVTDVASTVASDGTVNFTGLIEDGLALTAGQVRLELQPDVTTTVGATLAINGGTAFPIKMEDGGALPPRALRAFFNYDLRLTPGSEYRVHGSANCGPDGRDGFEGVNKIYRTVPQVIQQPWGTVSGTSLATITLLGRAIGNSLGDASDASADRAPIESLIAAINAVRPDGVQFNGVNLSADGTFIGDHPVITAGGAFYLVLYGMNDFFPAGYNAGQTIDGDPAFSFRGHLRRLIQQIIDVGALPIIATTFHAHPTRSRDNGHLNMPVGVPMLWPYSVAANVGPDDLVPSVADSVTDPAIDRTGFGVPTYGLKAFDHGNKIIREEVARFGGRAICADYEWASFRYAVEVEGWDALYPSPRHNHPNNLMYDLSVKRVNKEIALDLMSGRGAGKWLYRGDTVGA